MVGGERQVRNTFIYLLPTLVGGMLPIVSLPVFTRILTPEDWGAWALALAYGAFACSIANFGLVVSYERNFFQYSSVRDRSALLYSSLAFVIFALLVFGVLTWSFQHELARAITGSSTNGSLLFWVFCATGLTSLKAYYLTYFRNTQDARAHSKYSITENVLTVLFSLLFVAYFRVGVIGLAAGQLLGGALVLSVLVIRSLRRLPFSFRGTLLVESLKLSYPLAPRLLLNVFSTQFDVYIIGQLGSVGGAGVYAIGQKIANLVFRFMTALQNVFAPQVYERMFARAEGAEDTVGEFLTPFAYISIGAALLIGLFSEEAVTLLTPGSYHGATAIVNVMVMYYGVMFFLKQPQLMFAKKTFLISVFSVVGIGFTVGFVTVGTRLLGPVGAAWGMLASGMVSALLYTVVGQRYYPIRWQYRRMGMIFGLFFASTILILGMNTLGVDYAVRVVTKIALALLYLGLGVHIKLVSRESFSVLRKAFVLRSS
jgi:O-antigen/teichoic acid export membrane protein